MMDLSASVRFDANDLLGKRERAIAKNRLRQSGRDAGGKLSLLKMKKEAAEPILRLKISVLGKKNGVARKRLASLRSLVCLSVFRSFHGPAASAAGSAAATTQVTLHLG
jgi:hypothetical protein